MAKQKKKLTPAQKAAKKEVHVRIYEWQTSAS
jgi:hypothetical protein